MSEGGKSLLIVQAEGPLSRKGRELLHEQMGPLALRLGMEVVVCDAGVRASVHHDLAPLVAAIAAQTEAINALADSNMALVDAMIDGTEDGDGEELSRTYLDGSPR